MNVGLLNISQDISVSCALSETNIGFLRAVGTEKKGFSDDRGQDLKCPDARSSAGIGAEQAGFGFFTLPISCHAISKMKYQALQNSSKGVRQFH